MRIESTLDKEGELLVLYEKAYFSLLPFKDDKNSLHKNSIIAVIKKKILLAKEKCCYSNRVIIFGIL